MLGSTFSGGQTRATKIKDDERKSYPAYLQPVGVCVLGGYESCVTDRLHCYILPAPSGERNMVAAGMYVKNKCEGLRMGVS